MRDNYLFIISAIASFLGAFMIGMIVENLTFMYIVAMIMMFASGYINRFAVEKRLRKQLKKEILSSIVRNRYN